MFSKAYLVASFVTVAVAQVLPNPVCYQGGPDAAGPATDCSRIVDNFCNSTATVAIAPFNSLNRCYNLPDNNVCDPIAWNTYGADVPPSAANCKTVLNTVISKCNLGGYGQVSSDGYTFTVDVNHGQCGHDVHAGS